MRRFGAQDPKNSAHLLAYGELCEALKDEEGARNAYDEAIRVDPGMGKAHLRKVFVRRSFQQMGFSLSVIILSSLCRPLKKDTLAPALMVALNEASPVISKGMRKGA